MVLLYHLTPSVVNFPMNLEVFQKSAILKKMRDFWRLIQLIGRNKTVICISFCLSHPITISGTTMMLLLFLEQCLQAPILHDLPYANYHNLPILSCGINAFVIQATILWLIFTNMSKMFHLSKVIPSGNALAVLVENLTRVIISKSNQTQKHHHPHWKFLRLLVMISIYQMIL